MILEIKIVDKSKIISQNLPPPPAHRVTAQMRIRISPNRLISMPTVSPGLCKKCGDIDNSNSINLRDITYLAGYLYRGGAAPIC